MLIDLHGHSKGISRCCRADGKDIVLAAKEVGLDGIVLTNHYEKSYVVDGDSLDLAKRYAAEYEYVKQCGQNVGINVFFGIEVTMDKCMNAHLLVYGVNPEFVINYPNVYEYTQEELYKLVKKHNGILVQAHPLRWSMDGMLDPKYLDGVEINCHPSHTGTFIKEISKAAFDNNLILTCGGDYHADIYRTKCGVYLPDNVESIKDIVDYLKFSDTIGLCVQEKNEMTSYYYEYKRRK